MLVFPGPTHVTAVVSYRCKRVTLSCLGPQIGLDGKAGMAGALHMAFQRGLHHSMVFSEQAVSPLEIWASKLQNIFATFY